MYPEIMVIPMREELTRAGVKELRTVEEVDQALTNQPGTTMVVVNSICGCAAGRMRPAVRAAIHGFRRTGQGSHRPGPVVFHGLSTVLAFDCFVARWPARPHGAAQRY
jgi:hypothetical protein